LIKMNNDHATKEQLLQEMEELRQRLTKLEESQDWLSYIEGELVSAAKEKAVLLDTMVEPIFYLDVDLQTIWSNRAAIDSLGLFPGQAAALHFQELCDDFHQPRSPLNKALKSGQPQEQEIVFRDGRIWHMRVYPVSGPEGQTCGVLVALLEVTARKRAEEEVQRSLEKLQKAFEGVVQAMAMAMEMRDLYTSGHQQRVSQLACAIAVEMDLPEEDVEGLRVAGLLHDLGKIAVAAEILSKPGKINEYEFALIKAHPQIAFDILKGIEFPWPVAQIILQHHERLDGSGYPGGLKGEEILLEARILGVADVVEAMSSHRPYRPALGLADALEEISQKQGRLYDPSVVQTCVQLFAKGGFSFD